MDTKKCVTIRTADITTIDYQEYGILYNLTDKGTKTENTHFSSGDGWSGGNTSISLLDTPAAIGLTAAGGTPFTTDMMERHLHTQEAQIPFEQPLVVCLAKCSDQPPPLADIIAVTIPCGYVFVIHRGIWHSSSHGLYRDGQYYWQAWVYQNEPTVWQEIDGGAVEVLP